MPSLARAVGKVSGLRDNLEGGGRILLVRLLVNLLAVFLAVFLADPAVQDKEKIQAHQRGRDEAQTLKDQKIQGTQRVQRPQGTQGRVENLEEAARLKGKKAHFAILQEMVNWVIRVLGAEEADQLALSNK